MSNFLDDFIERGYLYQATNLPKLQELFAGNNKITAYIGFDCTAKSLHVGNLMQLMILRLLQQHGHKAIVIIGDATTTIGDPTGKTEQRKILTSQEIDANIEGVKSSIAKFLKFGDGPQDAILLRNSTWLNNISYMDFLRNYGRYISVNRMVGMESAKLRLENNQHLSFLEFNYMLIQGYDFCHLNQHYGCTLQFGGSDQWGNIVMGIEAAHKVYANELFGITTPLVTTADGAKMGKSVNGAVWINEEVLSPYDYYQFWRNCDDRDVLKFAKLYGEFQRAEIIEFTQLLKDDVNSAKKALALRLTSICHGQEKAENAKSAAGAIFESSAINSNMPTFVIDEQLLKTGVTISNLLSICGLASSNSEGKRLVRGNSVSINGQKVVDENLRIDASFLQEGVIKIASSAKKHLLLKI
jgi:tyrosyl-tRNA synthetase